MACNSIGYSGAIEAAIQATGPNHLAGRPMESEFAGNQSALPVIAIGTDTFCNDLSQHEPQDLESHPSVQKHGHEFTRDQVLHR